MVRKALYSVAAVMGILVIGWYAGPKPDYPDFNNEPITLDWDISEVDDYINKKESKVKHLKEDNQARVIWADSSHTQTEYSLVYLHGYTASQGEGEPLHRLAAEHINANLYVARLRDHGISSQETFRDITPRDWVQDAKEAIAIGKIIGEKVIVMSCSTGGTLSLYLAAKDTSIHSQILLSPNIKIFQPGVETLTGPWGKVIGKNLIGEYREIPKAQEHPYWTGTYHFNGLVALQYLLDHTMTDDIFQSIDDPLFLGYYYKNEEEQDHVVSVEAMKEFFTKVSTPSSDKTEVPFSNAGNHVISSKYKNDNWADVLGEVKQFLDIHTNDAK